MIWPRLSRQFISFGAIGTIGFLVDGGILTLLNTVFGIGLFLARMCSFIVAVTVTWALNRRLTFLDRESCPVLHEWARYACLNGLGALLNLAIFFWLVYRFEALAAVPLLPLAIAAAFALVFNFLVSKFFAFRGPQNDPKF